MKHRDISLLYLLGLLNVSLPVTASEPSLKDSCHFALVDIPHEPAVLESVRKLFFENQKSFAQKYPHEDFCANSPAADIFLQGEWNDILLKLNDEEYQTKMWWISDKFYSFLNALVITQPQKEIVHLAESISIPSLTPNDHLSISRAIFSRLIPEHYPNAQIAICMVRPNNKEFLALVKGLGFDQSEYAQYMLETEKYPASKWTFWQLRFSNATARDSKKV
jgi:hypothetical protein